MGREQADNDRSALDDHVVLTGANGVLHGMTAEAVNHIVDAAAGSGRVVHRAYDRRLVRQREHDGRFSLTNVIRRAAHQVGHTVFSSVGRWGETP